MSGELQAAHSLPVEESGPSEQTIERACSVVSDTTNGIASVKVERVTLGPKLERVARAVAAWPDVRLVLKVHPRGTSADLLIEQAIAPIHHQPPQRAACRGLLAHLLPRRWSGPTAPRVTSHADTIASAAMKDRP
jgi:hypothetical protein